MLTLREGAPDKVPDSQLFVGRRMVKESILPRGSNRLPTSLNLKGRSGWAASEVLQREVAVPQVGRWGQRNVVSVDSPSLRGLG